MIKSLFEQLDGTYHEENGYFIPVYLSNPLRTLIRQGFSLIKCSNLM